MYRLHQQPKAPIASRMRPFIQPIYLKMLGRVSTPEPMAAHVMPKSELRRLPFPTALK